MKKLNVPLTAILLSLIVSFAVLPMASAHSRQKAGNSYTAPMFHGAIHTPYHNRSANLPTQCGTSWPIQSLGSGGLATVSATTAPGNPVAFFIAPTGCANDINASVFWTPSISSSGYTPMGISCQWYDNTNPVGPLFTENTVFGVTQSTSVIFPTDVFVPSKSTSTFDLFILKCNNVFSSPSSPIGVINTLVSVSGDDMDTLDGLRS